MSYNETFEELRDAIFELSSLVSTDNHEKAMNIMKKLGYLMASLDCEYINARLDADAYHNLIEPRKIK